MKPEEKVFAALADKTKVEFALAQDIDTARNEVLSLNSSIQSKKGQVSKALFDLLNIHRTINQKSESILKMVNDLKSQSAKIGVDVPGKFLAIQDEMKKYSKDSASNFKNIDSITKSI